MGNNIDANATAYWSAMVSAVDNAKIQFATFFGNHDDAPFENSGQRVKAKNILSWRDLVEYEVSTCPTLSFTEPGPNHIHGVSNYSLLTFPAFNTTSKVVKPTLEVLKQCVLLKHFM